MLGNFAGGPSRCDLNPESPVPHPVTGHRPGEGAGLDPGHGLRSVDAGPFVSPQPG